MNILFYIPSALVGGIRTVTEILSESLRDRGHIVKWLLLCRRYGDGRDFPQAEDVTYLPSQNLLAPENMRFYAEYVKQNQIDIVINQHGLFEGVQLIDSIKESPVIRISVIHNNPTLNLKWLLKDISVLRNYTLKEKLKRVVRIILYPYIRSLVMSGLKRHYNMLLAGGSHVVVLSPRYIEPIQTINPNIVNISAIANPNTYIAPLYEISNKEKIVLFVGRLDNRSKKINELIRIWRKVIEQVNGWRFIIIGEGPDREALIEQASGYPEIEFIGYQNPRIFYERASILCLTSIFEGFPMVITEAMQHGCIPVAYGSFPAVYDMINDGEDGVIVDALNRNMYIQSLVELMNNKEMRFKMSQNANKNVQRFDRERIVEQWEVLFEKLKSNA